LVGLLAFAARNRFRLTPALVGEQGVTAKRTLARSVAAEALLGLVVVLAAGLLGGLTPAMHAEALWPFAWRPSLDALEEPDLVPEIATAAAWIVLSVLLAIATFFWRRRAFWGAALLAAAVIGLAAPHLSPLLVEAYPTQYWSSPTGFSVHSIAEGGKLFPPNCAVCHGAGGRGDGPGATGLPVPPADLTAEHLWAHADGELFWWLSHGMVGPTGELVMPGFEDVLSTEQRWALIDWIRANNAGVAHRATGAWPVPILAPGLAVSCGGHPGTFADLQGRVLRLVFAPSAPAPGVVTVEVGQEPGPLSGPLLCGTDQADAVAVYQTVTGIDAGELRRVQILVDPQGYLRLVEPADEDPSVLARAVADIAAHPIGASQPVHMHQH
ncbi:MAG TPA: c-type cytochrome, partial [Acetobacteraceae bacterium]|nr:c-type cytochrome [Acetobacteraceae bacterium]